MKWLSSRVSAARAQSPLSNIILVPPPNLLLILIPSLQFIGAQALTGLSVCDFILIGNLFERFSLIKPIRNERRNIHHGPDCLCHYCPPGFEANSPTAPLMPHALIDNEIGRPKLVEPCGAEGYSSGFGRRERQLCRRRLIWDAGFRPSRGHLIRNSLHP